MSELITIHFPAPYGRAHIRFPWTEGKRLRDYLRDPRLRRHALIQKARNYRVLNQNLKRVRFHHPLSAGDVVKFNRAGAWAQ